MSSGSSFAVSFRGQRAGEVCRVTRAVFWTACSGCCALGLPGETFLIGMARGRRCGAAFMRGRVGGHRKFDKEKYRQRNVVERCVSWLKECRRVATRYEKLAVNYLGMVDLAIIQRLLRLLSA